MSPKRRRFVSSWSLSKTSFLRILYFLAISCTCIPQTYAQALHSTPVRGVWVANVASSSLGSPQKIRDFVQLAHACNMNTLYVVVWNRGVTTYPSEVMQRRFGVLCDPRYAEFDMLKEIVDAAHAKNIRVIAWFEFGFSCSYGKPDGGHLIKKNPHWAAQDSAGNLATKNGFQWMNSFHPEVQDFILSLLKEVLKNYDVDGVQGDDRLPACPSTAGYDPWTVNLYQDQHLGRSPPANHLDESWINWRANRLDQFMERMYRELKSVSPDTVVSVAPSIYPWSKQNYLQNWPTWLENGWVDEVCPQVYREDLERYRAELNKIVEVQVSPEKLSKVFPGILIQTADRSFNGSEMVKAMVLENRKAGFSGEVYFYDAALNKYPELFGSLYE